MPGREAEWQRWYDDVHLDEVLAVPGFVGALRLQAVDGAPPMGPWLASYRIDAVDDRAANDALRRLQTADLTASEAMDSGSVVFSLYRDGVRRP